MLLTIITIFDPANLTSLMTFEMLQSYVNLDYVPINGYAVTDFAVLLGMILFRAGMLSLVQIDSVGQIYVIVVDNITYTVHPNVISTFCSIFLGA